jgi:p-cumate 2,3-dioxygenase subunit beta
MMNMIADTAARTKIGRAQVEDFLYFENDLLDQWRLKEWFDLFDTEGAYHIVTPGIADPDNASPETSLFLVSDDMERLAQRIDRLMKSSAHVEYPRSTTCHLVTNVRVSQDETGDVNARTRFVVYRTKADDTVRFFGHQIYRLRPDGDSFRIREKRCVLDFDTLSQQGKVTIIL